MTTYWENSCSFGLRYVSWYKYLTVSFFFFPHLGFWSGNLFLIAPFPDLCLLVPSSQVNKSPICLSTYIGDMSVPFQIICNSYTKIFDTFQDCALKGISSLDFTNALIYQLHHLHLTG